MASGIKFSFLSMSKQVGSRVPYGWDFHNRTPPASMPMGINTWGPSMCRHLAQRGHAADFVQIESPEFVRGFFCSGPTVTTTPSPGSRVIYTGETDVVRHQIESADVVLLRHHYPAYGPLFDATDHGHKPVIQFIAGHPAHPLGFSPASRRHRLLVNNVAELRHFAAMGIPTELFLKPADSAFYEIPTRPPPKDFDLAFVTWDTGSRRKRFDLLLAALDLAASRGVRLVVAVVGDTTSHDDAIDRITSSDRSVQIHRLGVLQADEVKTVYLRSRVSVVASAQDANPQVIVQSLACDTPVACARDITGGTFQINPATGELFDPTPEALLDTIVHMLSRLDRYRPRRSCTDLDDAVDQVLRLAALDDGTWIRPGRPRPP